MERNTRKKYDFEQLAADHARLIGKICCMYASDAADWQDLYQEVLINLWRGFDDFEGRSGVSTWIWRVGLNTCISCCRRNRRHAGALPLTANLGVADGDAERDERLRTLYELIGCLGDLDRAVVMLWLDERSYDEIAAITGLSRSNIASRLHRIRAKLARLANR